MPNGAIFAGKRHNDCISAANYTIGPDVKELKPHWEMGFMTTKGRFVGRKEAFRMMITNDIESACPSGYRHRLGELFSEDLY